MKTRRLMRELVIILVVMSLSAVAAPQSFTGIVSGRVLDERGAVIAQATLELKNIETGFMRPATADAAGEFRFISIPPGRYSLTAQAQSFASATVRIEVTVAGEARADVTLRAAGPQIREQVNVPAGPVNAAGGRIETERGGELSQVIDQRQIVELPLLTRNIYELVYLAPGAALTSESFGGLVGSRGGAGIGLSVNGQRSSGGNYVLDGGENNNIFDAGPAQNVSVEAIKEFRIITNNYTAEYGRNAGFIANIVSTTGTNDLHGSAFVFNRNSVFSANSFDNNAFGLDKPVFNRSHFGASIGGPVRKDKLHFFGTIEPVVVRSIAESRFFVPTQELVSRSAAGTKAIFDRIALPPDRSTDNDIILRICPAGRICNPATGAGFEVIPAFTTATRSGPRNVGAGLPQDSILGSARIDYNISPRAQFFGRYSIDDQEIFPPVTQPYTRSLDQGFRTRNQSLLFNFSYVVSNTMVMESRIVYGRSSDKFPATATAGTDSYFPAFFGPGTLPFGSDELGGIQNLYQFYDTFSYVRGNHLFKFGGQYVHIRDRRIPPVLSQLPVAQFFSVQSLVNGRMSIYSITFDPQGKLPGENVTPSTAATIVRHYRYNEAALFFQDSWKVTPRLTLSTGIRWEYMGVLHSAGHERNLDANFYYGEGSNPFERIANGSFSLVDSAPGKFKGHFYLPDYNNFAPRLGLAYDLFGTGTTVFRSGVGVFYDRNFGNQLSNVAVNPPAFVRQTFGDVPFNADFVTRDHYAPIRNFEITLAFVPARHLDQNLRTAYTISWNAGIERRIGDRVLAGVTYVGASGVKLYALTNPNRINSGVYLGRPRSDDPFNLPNTLLDQVVDGVPFPAVAELNTRSNQGHSTYHGLQIRVETGEIQRLGLQFGANYTWSHSIDNISSVFGLDSVAKPVGVGFLDSFNPGLDRGDSDFDTRQRFVANFIWDIPFGRKSENWVARNVFGGWGVSGIVSFQTGQPFSIFDSGNPENFGFEPSRPVFNGEVSTGSMTPHATIPNTFLFLPLNAVRDGLGNCLSTGPFRCSTSVVGPFDGTISRNIFRRPGTQFHNLAITRTFSLAGLFNRDGAKLQLRAEFYNPFNHANLYVDAGTNDVANPFFVPVRGQAAIPSVTVRRGNGAFPITAGAASFIDNRQMVIAVKLIF
ncbi:MAG: carboxypeptidase regulatory-like domain-containing protein [Acidobacteriota bacterium]